MHRSAYKLRCPVQIALAHRLAHSFISGSWCDKKATIANVAASTWVVGLDVEAPKADFTPVHIIPFHLVHGLNSANVSKDHYCAEVTEPIRTKSVQWQWVDHGIGVPALNFLV